MYVLVLFVTLCRSHTLWEWGLDTHTKVARRLDTPAWETHTWWGRGTHSMVVWGWPDCRGRWVTHSRSPG